LATGILVAGAVTNIVIGAFGLDSNGNALVIGARIKQTANIVACAVSFAPAFTNIKAMMYFCTKLG
jgi:hypothetical protein